MNKDKAVKIAYIMSRFPKLSETFVLYELLAMEELGHRIEIYPLMRCTQQIVHPEAEELVERAHYNPFISWRIARANLAFLRRGPKAYLKTVVEVLRGTFGSAKFFRGALGILPKSVLFASEMERQGITHVHAHFATHPTVAALVIHRLTGIPFSFTTHGSDLHVDRRMLDVKMAAASFGVTCTYFNKEIMVKTCGEETRHRIHVIRYGIEFDLFCPVAKADRGGACKIICVGSFEEVKGHKYLIDACRILRDRQVNFVCEFVGDGPMRPQIEKQIAREKLDDKIILHGGRIRKEVAKMLQACDVKVAPSVPTAQGKREGMPNVLIEAMAVGLPVVSTKLTGIPELVETERTGLLVSPCDVPALADALQRLCEDPALRARMGVAARKKVLQEFDRKENTAALARLILNAQVKPTQKNYAPIPRAQPEPAPRA